MPDQKMISIIAGGLLIYQGWMDANTTAATTTQQMVGWGAVAVGALLIFQNMK